MQDEFKKKQKQAQDDFKAQVLKVKAETKKKSSSQGEPRAYSCGDCGMVGHKRNSPNCSKKTVNEVD